jgi:pimeloyl-ACP methyl ester carboxylesterase
VFAINGSGSLQATSTALARAVADAGLPLAIVTVEWSQGRIVTDQTDWRHAREEGCRLAGQIVSCRQANPGQAIYLVAHSAGSGVALTAVATAPPGSVNRVILLAPSVSSDYDLRPALRGTRDGIDVFYSRRDRFALGLGVALVGTSDGCRGCRAAGRDGFRAHVESSEDAALYAKLRQYPWERCQARLGNHGFHMGTLRPGFLHTVVLPLLNPNP